MARPNDPRSIAARTLERVERQGAFAAAALDAELRRAGSLDARDRALATELVYGVLRTRAELTRRLEAHAAKGLPKDTKVLTHLRIATYQLLALDRIPDHAAVDAAVTAVRRDRGTGLSRFANAVLRRVAKDSVPFDVAEAAWSNVPDWLRRQLVDSVGESEARALLEPDDHVSVRLLGEAPKWMGDGQPGRASPRAIRLRQHGDLTRRDGYAEGTYVIQEEGAQVVGLALGARPGERVLDACAGRGGKSSLLVEQVGPAGEVWATDRYPKKLDALVREHERLGLAIPHTTPVEWPDVPSDFPRDFDRVLVDAPCSGVGTLRRRPEILLRLEPSDPERLGGLAESILRGAAERARPGGAVVFAVCSVLVREAEDVVQRVADCLEPVPFPGAQADDLARGKTQLRIGPTATGTDGYYIASFRRR